MHGNREIDLTDSPAPGVIPGPVCVHEGEDTVHDQVPEAPTADPVQLRQPEPKMSREEPRARS